jgi:hypothetical protein
MVKMIGLIIVKADRWIYVESFDGGRIKNSHIDSYSRLTPTECSRENSGEQALFP